MFKTDKSFLLFTVALALILRLAHLLLTSGDPYYTILYGDAKFFEQAAKALAGGSLNEQLLEATLSPVYLWFAGAIYKIFGPHPFTIRAVQSVLGALAPLLFYAAGRKLWSPRAGKVSAFLAAVSGILIFYDAEILKPSLINVIFAALIVPLVTEKIPFWPRWILAGFLFGCLALLRMNFLAALPFLTFWIAVSAARAGWSRRLGAAAVFLFAFALTWAGWMKWLDYAAPRRAANDVQLGIHFYIGNNESTEGVYKPVKGVKSSAIGHNRDARDIAEKNSRRSLSDWEVNRYWIGRGIGFIRSQPYQWLALEGKKFFLIFNDYEVPGAEHFGLVRARSPVLALPLPGFGLIAALGGLGVFLTWKQRRNSERLLLGLTFFYVLSLLLFFVRGDYRLPLCVPLILFAGAAIDRAAALFQSRDPRRLKKAAAVFTVLFIFTHYQTFLPENRFYRVGEKRLYSRQAAVSAAKQELPAKPPY